ncbi:MAG: hypothetical protein WA964_16630 [Ilumatobacter sp.]|uniref:hypothetical protein n=1 Tax=Ilumatobacter sp. TaxID=1967498 RepID=UPI003C74578A
MPRADDYWTAASDIATEITSLSDMSIALLQASEDAGCSGTEVAESVRLGLVAATTNAGAAAGELQSLVEELERRARLCEDYTEEINTYYWITLPNYTEAQASFEASSSRGGSAPPPGNRPQKPDPPFRGAVHG